MRSNAKLILYIVCLSTFFASLMQNIYSPIIPLLRDTFQVSLSMVNASVSVFIFIVAIMQIVCGALIDVKGARFILMPSIVIAIAASIGCAVTKDFAWFLVFRALQAVGTAAIPLIAATTIGSLFHGAERGSAMGSYQMLLSIAPAAAPVLGGFIGERYSYPGIFWFLTAVSVALLLANGSYYPKDTPKRAASINLRSMVVQYGAVFRNSVGRGILTLGFLYFFLYFAILVYLPALLTDHYHLSLAVVGLLYLPMAISTIIGTVVYKAIQAKVAHSKLFLYGNLLAAGSIIIFALTESFSLAGLSIGLVLYGIAGGVIAPLFSTMVSNEFEEQRASALGIYNLIRYIGMSAGPLICRLVIAMLGSSIGFAAFGVLFAILTIWGVNRIHVQPVSHHVAK
ncbi:MFS transporter [Paenibacillus alvei]|uniref:MFS transporter n=1 Tax=Paenibacillus alvei TaxID=44250 RepID=A0ABT4GTY2_PAEAL|nr:MFS transporter [Paenibacillus alvei]EJW16356.1 putative MFS-type transporter YvmA [Paenibacillus alvei DSM 29]MCY9543058.1 MFS transporter [Paenibacillus alvei]MCY9707833.1 MFS transporter [Paenibacillus alvei]MCY9736314.1 MFS transporter [Paenibacillus alvei]MCY9757011.1 MFS transporter [Paenibacillus alvei]